ncbi:MAG: peptidyl-prolyl cis-trans isomerase, partial [Deltaproteobacteria bacterium]|nr:peptidyl-prolyl cis-trans isomerase [Deltaproteobacteria bacterium]
MPMPSWKAVAREPLVHFVVLGVVLFAIDAWRSPAQPVTPAPQTAPAPAPSSAPPVTAPNDAAGDRSTRRSIVIDAEATKRIAEQATRRLGRAPTAAELAEETDRWIDEEVLFREAVARGLDRDDPVIHARVAERMSYVLEQAAIVPEPTEAELRAWFDANRELWGAPDRIDFTHVYVAGTDASATARIDELATALAAGASPDAMGDRFSGGRRYRGRKLADLAQAFGDEFVAGLATQPPATWARRRSRHGLHLVRVDRAEAGRAADFASARLDVRRAW